MQIKYLTTDEFKDLIRETVVETLEEYLGDSDVGKEVREEVKQKLLGIRKRREADHFARR